LHGLLGGYVVKQHLIVQPYELDSPFVLLSESGEWIVMLVIPMEFLYGSLSQAIVVEGKNMYNKEKLASSFIDHMSQVINESVGNNNHAK
jgi:hypothetical protein